MSDADFQTYSLAIGIIQAIGAVASVASLIYVLRLFGKQKQLTEMQISQIQSEQRKQISYNALYYRDNPDG